MARRAAFGENLVVIHNEDTEGSISGLGELRARRPGKTDEKDHAVRLARHDVKIRISGNVARTEIEEVFSNETDDELEGLYRFPLPPGAQMERLALDVDGKLVDGEFVDSARAQAIWRGIIHHAAPTAPKPREELVWVPGPWRDPALLEWKRGGRFELKIFPIPKRGSRRVVLAYTEVVAPASGVRRYTYPLPQSTSSDLVVDAFHVDAQVVGHDRDAGVKVRGYELTRTESGGEVKLTASEKSFRPSGDLVLEYALPDKGKPLTAFAYEMPPASAARPGAAPERFAALALRPRLPKWTDVRPRDQVIVVDSGRAMFGERFQRARRLAVQVAQEMDRRDRVTVVACDVRCKPLGAGFVGPGSGAAQDIGAFLSGVTPDGASDLVGAVRAAAQVRGRDGSRDLRVVLISSGSASAGYRSLDRAADEVKDALVDGRSSLVAVPVGTDADTAFLGEMARGGGGVVVPYQPGAQLASAALDVLNATYGTALRDVELKLPDGLVDVAPAALPPLRAGSETLVAARMTRDRVEGDLVLKGTVGGEPFEEKIAISLTATATPGNAFVPRLYAANRIADREVRGSDTAKAELIDLSRRFAVPSRFTSLLVLESEAMFQAFGIARERRGPSWNAEQGQAAFMAAGEPAADEARSEGMDDLRSAHASATPAPSAATAGPRGDSNGMGLSGTLGAGPGNAPQKAARDEAEDKKSKDAPAPPMARAAPTTPPWDPSPGRRGGQWMRRVWHRVAVVHEDVGLAAPADRIAAARAALAAAPDERGKHRELARLLALTGDVKELEGVLTRWSERDPLDVDAVAWRADLAARTGDRDAALRVLSGTLAQSTSNPLELARLAQAAAEAFERVQDPAACALRVTVSELRLQDVEAAARAIRCEEPSRPRSAARFRARFVEPAKKSALDAALTKLAAEKIEASRGDVVVSATWEGGEDLDIAIVDPAGARASVVSRLSGVRVVDATSRDREEIGLSNAKAGNFIVEIARATKGDRPVSGKLKITSSGATKTIPFVLSGERATVARVEARYESELVPTEGVGIGWDGGLAPFDRGAAMSAVRGVSVAACGNDGPITPGRVRIVFDPSGRVQAAAVEAPFSGTRTGACVASRYRTVRIPPFAGGAVTVVFPFRAALAE